MPQGNGNTGFFICYHIKHPCGNFLCEVKTLGASKHAAGRHGLSRQARTDITGYLFILPNIIGVLAFTLFPLLFSLYISFTDWEFTKGIGNWSFNGGAN